MTKTSHLPLQLQLLLDVVLIALFFSLDVRDLAYKTKWLGPEDSYAFTTATGPLRLEPQPLAPTLNGSEASYAPGRGRAGQNSGWNSFLQKCESLQAFRAADGKAFAHVLASNCAVGPIAQRTTLKQLVLASSVRADSMAWAACKMLFHHRKPPICHSPIVRLFGHRYNMDDKPSLVNVTHSTGETTPVGLDETQGAYSATPGSDAEGEIFELLNVISKSSPIGSAVCVEGFVPRDGAGFYTASVFGCASANFYRSAFVGILATSFPQYHQNKAWLASDMLHISGMTYMIRENRRSVFELRGSSSTDSSWVLDHHTQLNFSSFGVLYTIATAIDLLLVAVHVYSAVEIVHLMLWPLWKSLRSAESVVSRTNSAAFAAEDCQAVLTASLYRSKTVVVLILVSCVLHWTTVVPNSIVLSEGGVSSGARLHAALSTFRFWMLVLITLHTLWDAVVAWFEKQAFAVVHRTYITVAEVAGIAGIVGYLRQSTVLSLAATKYASEGQRVVDATSFSNRVAVSNAFPEHHDSLQNTSASVVSLLFSPLVAIVLWSLVSIACFCVVRAGYLQLRYPSDSLSHHHNSRLFVHRAKSNNVVKPDLDTSGAGTMVSPNDDSIPIPPAGPGGTRPGSPKRHSPELSDVGAVMPASGTERDLRLPLEKVVDIPIRARSLVRSGWKMEKKIGHQIFLRPPQYLEHGIILQGGCLKTRFGFSDIVHPYLRAGNHVMPEGEASHPTSSSGSSSPRRSRSFDKMHRQNHRQPLVPLR